MSADQPGNDLVQVLVVSNVPATRYGLGAMLEAESGFEVSHSAGNAGGSTGFDLLLIDGASLDETGIGELLEQHPGVPPVIVGLGDWTESPVQGGEPFALLDPMADGSTIGAAAMAVLHGLIVTDPSLEMISGQLTETTPGFEEQPDELLTPREREVLELVAAGLPNKAIAQQLGISEHTVKFHVGSLLEKLSAQSRAEAVMVATRRGLLPV